jgi:hypothetical protein
MIPRSMQIVVALVFLLAGAFGLRSLVIRWGILDRSPPVVAAKSSIDIQFLDIRPRAFRNYRATECVVMASIQNASPYHVNDVSVRLGDWLFRFNTPLNLGANGGISQWNVGTIDTADDNSGCADQALTMFNTIAQAKPWACAVDGLLAEECRSLVRISTRMNPDVIAGIRYDEYEMGKRNVAAIEAAIPDEISFITDRIDNRSATAGGRGADAKITGGMTNDVVVLHATDTRYFIGDGPQAGWHSALYEKCSKLSILNKGGLAAFDESTAQSFNTYRDIPPGYVWYAQADNGSVRYGQVRIADIAPSIFVAKCDAATAFAELAMPRYHADDTPMVYK